MLQKNQYIFKIEKIAFNVRTKSCTKKVKIWTNEQMCGNTAKIKQMHTTVQ